MSTAGKGILKATPLPAGFVIADPPVVSPSSLVLEERKAPRMREGRRMVVWTPSTGQTTDLGAVNHIVDLGGPLDAPTAAWVPVGCEMQAVCDLHLLDLASGAQRIVKAPPGALGFYGGGEFSPDGSLLAAFVATGRGSDQDPKASLAIIDVRDGSVQLIGDPFRVGEPRGWASWTPGAVAPG